MTEPDEQTRLEAQRAQLSRSVERLRDEYGDLTDEELIAQLVPTPDHVTAPMELQRRHIVAIRELDSSIGRLEQTTNSAGAQVATLTQWLIGFTVLLVILTIGVAVLTAVVAAKG